MKLYVILLVILSFYLEYQLLILLPLMIDNTSEFVKPFVGIIPVFFGIGCYYTIKMIHLGNKENDAKTHKEEQDV